MNQIVAQESQVVRVSLDEKQDTSVKDIIGIGRMTRAPSKSTDISSSYIKHNRIVMRAFDGTR